MEFMVIRMVLILKKARNKSGELFPLVAILVLTGIRPLTLLGLMGCAPEVDTRGERAANLDGRIDLHDGNKYGTYFKKIKTYFYLTLISLLLTVTVLVSTNHLTFRFSTGMTSFIP